MNKVVQRVALGSTKQALIVSDIEFDKDGFQVSQRSAVVSIDPENDPQEMLEKAKTKKWELYGEPSIRGNFVQARIIGDLNEADVVRQTNNAATTVLEGDDVAQPARR